MRGLGDNTNNKPTDPEPERSPSPVPRTKGPNGIGKGKTERAAPTSGPKVPRSQPQKNIDNSLQPQGQTPPFLLSSLGTEPFLISIWNMQGQSSGAGVAKQLAIRLLFSNNPSLDMMLLQEAGDFESNTFFGTTGKSFLPIILEDKFKKNHFSAEETIKIELTHVIAKSESGYEDELGVIWYCTHKNMAAKNVRCSMAIIYRVKKWFGGTIANSEELKECLKKIIRWKFYIDKNSSNSLATQAEKLRPTIGILHPSGTMVYSMHAPSCSNRFPAKVSFDILGRISHENSVLAGDFNFQPQELVHMESAAKKAQVSNFHFDISPDSTHRGGRRLDFAMGNCHIKHVPEELLHFNRMKELEKFLQERVDAVLAKDETLKHTLDEIKWMMNDVENNPHTKYCENDIRIKAEDRQTSIDLIKKKAYAEFPHAFKKGLSSDHLIQFFLVNCSPPASPKTMKQEQSKTYAPMLELIERVKATKMPRNGSRGK